ncbi:MAG TPA: hypothetical protein VND93_25340 [Myxococcales bacterium]|nr:hypothetical protein [Myxococcales bacterium]
MNYGSVAAGVGTPVGGATSNFGATSIAPATGQGTAAPLYDFGRTVDLNMFGKGLQDLGSGLQEMAQSGAFGGTNTYAPYNPAPQQQAPAPTPNTTTQNTTPPADNTSAQLNQILSQLNDLTTQLSGMIQQLQAQPQAPAPAPAPAPQQQAPAPAPQPDPVAQLVGRANVDPQLKNAVTQVAQDPVGNKLLNGAVNDGLKGIGLANMPAGFFGQTLPLDKQVQIAPQTLGGQDLVRTIAHELTHAATLGNGDSLKEEQVADQLGTDVQRRVNGNAPGYVLGGDAYKGLPADNGILDALKQLGITL